MFKICPLLIRLNSTNKTLLANELFINVQHITQLKRKSATAICSVWSRAKIERKK